LLITTMAALGLAPPDPSLAVIRVDALETTLTKLNITQITAAQLLDAVKKEEKISSPPQAPSGRERTKALLIHVKNTPSGQYMQMPPYKSTFTMEPVNDRSNVDKERRSRLRDLAKKDFPGGKIPDPYTSAWLNVMDGAAMRDLPFIQATIRVSPYAWPDGTPKPVQAFQDIWVLWDTGAQVSQILSTQLHDNIKKDEHGVVQSSGFAVANVKFHGVEKEIEANIAFRPNMPNNTTFIILGQQTLLNSLQYQIQTTVINPTLSTSNPYAYGQIDLTCYRDPVTHNAPLVPL